jgi:hypothetical protein
MYWKSFLLTNTIETVKIVDLQVTVRDSIGDRCLHAAWLAYQNFQVLTTHSYNERKGFTSLKKSSQCQSCVSKHMTPSLLPERPYCQRQETR